MQTAAGHWQARPKLLSQRQRGGVTGPAAPDWIDSTHSHDRNLLVDLGKCPTIGTARPDALSTARTYSSGLDRHPNYVLGAYMSSGT
jgi:hypothetical protein